MLSKDKEKGEKKYIPDRLIVVRDRKAVEVAATRANRVIRRPPARRVEEKVRHRRCHAKIPKASTL